MIKVIERKMKDPSKLTLRELRLIDRVVRFSDEEIQEVLRG